jgi:hypothetical protein
VISPHLLLCLGILKQSGEVQMKFTSIAITMLLLISSAWAKKDLNPADYPLTAHVVSNQSTRVRTSSYSQKTGYANGVATQRSTDISIGNIVYTSSDEICGVMTVGMDYPALLEKNKIKSLAGSKACTYNRLSGSREDK